MRGSNKMQNGGRLDWAFAKPARKSTRWHPFGLIFAQSVTSYLKSSQSLHAVVDTVVRPRANFSRVR
jgi:hypothetical protein